MMVLDALERQIVAALQLDPRCPWRKIAAVLGEAERIVGRRATQLLESGAVAVVGVRPRSAAMLVDMRCTPGVVRAAAQSLAQRNDTTFVYTTTGTGDCVAEILTEHGRMGDVLSEELPSTIGLKHSTSYPVLRYFRTIRGWRPEVLGADRARVIGLVEAAFADYDAEPLLNKLDQAGIPAGRVRTLKEVYAWPQLASQGLLVDVDHPLLGTVTLPGPPLRFFDNHGGAEATRRTHTAPPLLDQHGAGIRAWLAADEAAE
ncbi:CoA transferase [Pseudarthrobacter sp. S9]|uniref:Lrp/AsnC family transcriptional regulator n=1 Tax=Pseudarthrobacter sp. S9 TaxID=3418421 RepID=UPI003D055B0B